MSKIKPNKLGFVKINSRHGRKKQKRDLESKLNDTFREAQTKQDNRTLRQNKFKKLKKASF